MTDVQASLIAHLPGALRRRWSNGGGAGDDSAAGIGGDAATAGRNAVTTISVDQPRDFVDNPMRRNKPAVDIEMTPTASLPKSPLPGGWRELTNETSGQVYFYNEVTKETSWDRPDASTPASDATSSPPVNPMMAAHNPRNNRDRRLSQM